LTHTVLATDTLLSLPRSGVFGLLQLVAFVQVVRSHLPAKQFQTLLTVFVVAVFVIAFAALVAMTMSGTIAPWTGRFYSLWDTGYAKIHSAFCHLELDHLALVTD
jgi:asparagine N-glycosylation enzyme membrane subunit Stt3